MVESLKCLINKIQNDIKNRYIDYKINKLKRSILKNRLSNNSLIIYNTDTFFNIYRHIDKINQSPNILNTNHPFIQFQYIDCGKYFLTCYISKERYDNLDIKFDYVTYIEVY